MCEYTKKIIKRTQSKYNTGKSMSEVGRLQKLEANKEQVKDSITSLELQLNEVEVLMFYTRQYIAGELNNHSNNDMGTIMQLLNLIVHN